MSTTLEPPVAVIGAGPVGLAAAAHLAERGIPFVVLEAGEQVGAAIADWGHVRLFSPWRYNIDRVARALLQATGWAEPDPGQLPTGAELITDYLRPLAAHPAIAAALRLGVWVEAISRLGYDRVRSHGRESAPFLLRVRDGDGIVSELAARAVIDASGTWMTPNTLGANGLPAYGEADPAALITPALPDVLGVDRDRFAHRHTVVVGAGHSATTTLLALADLAYSAPGTEITWAIRAGDPGRAYGGGEADALPARGAIGTRIRDLVQAGLIRVVPGFFTHAVLSRPDGVDLISSDPAGAEQKLSAEVVVNATGFRPDHTLAAELRLDLDPILGATRALAPLIDPNVHSCGTVPPHGVDELTHPESGYYAIGVKSYGRAPTFLLATGYEQARSVTAALAGDWDAARNVRLELPETGVCSTDIGQGLATGVSGGLRAVPLLEPTAVGCCG
ncbi:MAG TPA: FAD-dependent oxidoreductase [Actinophytocola sp.]|uniref:FAD-dependent oxidoreductase n=1 Tax=Actinophytocola sp. TaxID=1872138 RepID=UPI002DBDB808|nr:FAD-dependent oxidoreductase [Actinophytocola sp.]HEU5470633.1 FAD-dependent oxidoreductase [Actinophytocola sp.]